MRLATQNGRMVSLSAQALSFISAFGSLPSFALYSYWILR